MKFHPVCLLLTASFAALGSTLAQEPTPAPATTVEKIVDRAVKGRKADVSAEKVPLSAAEIAELVSRQLSALGEMKDAKVVNINVQVGDTIVTLGLDEGIDAEEWGMVDNQVEGGAVAGGGAPAAAVAANENRPPANRKIDLRKGNLYLVATEEHPAEAAARAAAPSASPSPSPAVEAK